MVSAIPDHNLLPSQLKAVVSRFSAGVGPEAFWRHYPHLAERLLAGPPTTADCFVALRKDAGHTSDRYDMELLNAARLDLQSLDPPEHHRYVGDGSARESALLDRIAGRLGLPFGIANYIPHISGLHRYLYTATPKVACTTIKRLLQAIELGTPLDYFGHIGHVHDRAISPLLEPLDDIDTFFEALERPDWFRFTVVRNPFSRILSAYINKIEWPGERDKLLVSMGLPGDVVPSFHAFLKAISAQTDHDRDIHWATQSWLTAFNRIDYDFVGRFEQLDETFATLSRRLAREIPPTEIERVNVTDAQAKLAQYFGPEEIALVREIYQQDFANFGYPTVLP